MLRGWFDSEGSSMDFSEYTRGDGGSGGGKLCCDIYAAGG